MADENPAEQSAPVTGTAKAKPKAKPSAKKRKVTMRTKKTRMIAPKTVTISPGLLIGVYVVLGLLALGLSFWTGYLVGQSDGSTTTRSDGVFEGKLQVVEYSDFECPFCARAVPTVEQIKSTYGDKVEVVFKNFPLESIHPNAFNAAVAAECVRELEGEEAFWEYHDTLFENQQALDAASLKRYAQGIGGFDKCFDNQETAQKVRDDMQEAQSRGVQGTPSFWIDGELVVGAQPFNVFQQAIDAKLSGAAPSAPSAPSAPQPSAPQVAADVEPGRYPTGSADAPVEIIEFTDYECPFCARHYTQTEPQIMEQYVKTGKVRYTVRHFPLSFHPNAQKASEAAECAGQQGKFWEMHNAIFENQQSIGVSDLKKYAATIGLDTTKFNTCLDSGATASIVQADFQAGQAAGVSGTPSFYINGKQLVGAVPFSNFQQMIDAELQ
jgi:protein-disulfide isomerase